MRSLAINPRLLAHAATLIAITTLCGCVSHQAFEGNPMPPEQVTSNLEVVSPKGTYDSPPSFSRGFAPFFPEAEGRSRKVGYAMAEFTINPNGSVSHVRIIKATTYNFAEEAGYTVRDWRFKPAKKNGQAVPVRARLPFTFRQS